MFPHEYSSQGKTGSTPLLGTYYACIIDHYTYVASFNQDSNPLKLVLVF